MNKFLLRKTRHGVLRLTRFWYQKWGEKNFLMVLAVMIGAITAVAAALLHAFVTRLEEFSRWLGEFSHGYHQYGWIGILFLLPLVGLLLSFLFQRAFGGPRYAKSLSPLILALNRKRTDIPLSETVSHMCSSALAVGFGGSAGLEAPSVLTGAAIGANSGGFFRISRQRRSLLLGCGAAAAISAIFDSPIAGVLFAAEVLLPEFSVSALVPMVMSSAVAAVVSRVMIGDSALFLAIKAPWRTNAVPYYILCAILTALVGVYVIRAAYFIADRLKRRFRNSWTRLFAGGAALCVLLLLFPVMRGQGYWAIEKLFTGDTARLLTASSLFGDLPGGDGGLMIVVVSVLFLKVIASVLTVDSGGDGGIFAPSMFIGAFTGFGFARLVNLSGIIELQECNFVAVGMCGVFTAVMRAPLTGIFLIAEVTGGYILLVPLMIVSSVSYFVARFFEPNSIYRKALAESNLLGDDRDESMLRRLAVRLSVDKNFVALQPTMPLSQVNRIVEETRCDAYPVLDERGRLLGLMRLEKVLQAMLHPEIYGHLLAFDLMETPRPVLSPDDDLACAMAEFDRSGLKVLPVCGEDEVFLGFLDKAPIFAKYRNMVRESDSF